MCYFCKDKMNKYLIDKKIGQKRFMVSVWSDGEMDIDYFGVCEDGTCNPKEHYIDETIEINYCPMCGKKF